MPDVLLRDERVRLREWCGADAQWYAAESRDEEIQRFTTEPATLSEGDVARAIARLAELPDSAGFVITDSRTGRRLGNIALYRQDGVGHVSYWIAAAARGQGVATRAVHLLSQWAFAEFAIVELRLEARVDNLGSRRVAEKAGFVRDEPHDRVREVKGGVWEMAAYSLDRRADAVGR
jgi:RimJ/RimL family protein N-acetyltransferase